MELNIKKLEAHRIVFNENPRVFAKRIGVSHQWYYAVIAGKNSGVNPRLETINKIAENLGLDPKDLIK
jgi:transcriptional regulator with XRE-family HTH domain